MDAAPERGSHPGWAPRNHAPAEASEARDAIKAIHDRSHGEAERKGRDRAAARYAEASARRQRRVSAAKSTAHSHTGRRASATDANMGAGARRSVIRPMRAVSFRSAAISRGVTGASSVAPPGGASPEYRSRVW